METPRGDRFHNLYNESPKERATGLAKEFIGPYVRDGVPLAQISASYPGMGRKGTDVGVGYPIFTKFGQPDQKRIPVSPKQIGVHLEYEDGTEYVQVFPLQAVYREVAKELGKTVPQDKEKPPRRQTQQPIQKKEQADQPSQFGLFASREKASQQRKRRARRTIVTKDGEEINQMSLFTEDTP